MSLEKNILNKIVECFKTDNFLKNKLIYLREPIKQDEEIEAMFIYIQSKTAGNVAFNPKLSVIKVVIAVNLIAAGRSRKITDKDSLTEKKYDYLDAIEASIIKCNQGYGFEIDGIYNINLDSILLNEEEKRDVAEKQHLIKFTYNFHTFNK